VFNYGIHCSRICFSFVLPLDLGSSSTEDDAAEELWEGLEHSLLQLGGW
jgi:hypothetical protein